MKIQSKNLMVGIIACASILIICSFAAFSMYVTNAQRASMSKDTEASVFTIGDQAAASIANWINGHAVLATMAAELLADASDEAAIQKVLTRDVLKSNFSISYYGTEAKGEIFNSQPVELPDGYDPRKRPWYQLAKQTQGLALTEPYIDVSSGNLVISAVAPVKQDGRMLGVVSNDFSLETLRQMIGSVDIGGKGYAFLVSKAGKILVHNDRNLTEKTLADAFPVDTPSIRSSVMTTEVDGKTKLVAFVPVKGLNSIEWYLGFVLDADTVYASANALRTAATIATLLAVIAMIGLLGVCLHRLVIGPITNMTLAMNTLAAGNLDAVIPGENRADQIGDMARAVKIFRENAVERIRLEDETEANRNRSEQERIERERLKARETADVQVAVDSLAAALSKLSDGDVSHRIDRPFAPDLDGVRADFNRSAEKLQDALREVARNVRGIDAGANEIGAASDDLAQRTEQQAASVEETAAALEQITTAVKDATRRAQEAGQLVGRAKTGAEKSGDVVRNAIVAMERIEQSSGEIANIISVIDEIAFQTNLLALNAGVEAARAGDAGKGFAVVAQEVRELAQRSANAAKEIKALITTSNAQVQEGVQLVGETGAALNTIVADVQEINRHVIAIAESAQEQSSGLQEINTAVNRMDQDTQKNAAMVEETTAASHALANEVASLNRLLDQFRLSNDAAFEHGREARRPVSESRPVVPSVRNLTRKVASAFSGNVAINSRNGNWEEF